MSVKELREQQRIAETSHLGPGHVDGHLKPFGSEVRNSVSFGSKYKFKPDENPVVGKYDVEKSLDYLRPSRAVKISGRYKTPVKGPEVTPDPGTYDRHLKPFGSIKKKIDFGSKYKFKPKEGPAPGQYDIESAEKVVKKRASSPVNMGKASRA